MQNDLTRGKTYNEISFEGKEAWKGSREKFAELRKEQGLPADVKVIENQMEKIREAIWENESIAEVMHTALEIVVPDTILSRVDFWRQVMHLYMVLPAERFGCSILEYAEEHPAIGFRIKIEGEETSGNDRDAFIYDLSSKAQWELFQNLVEFNEDSYEVLDLEPSEAKQILDNTDVQAQLVIRDVNIRRLGRARSRLRRISERLDEPDRSIDMLSELMDSKGIKEESPFQSVTNKIARQVVPKIGRNAPCPCGSGLKYKHCCGKSV